MFNLNAEMAAKVREKRARKNITLEDASQQVGISSKTLSLVENERRMQVKKTVYEKLVNWLIDYEPKQTEQ